MLLFAPLLVFVAAVAYGQDLDDDWVDPYDMLNYDAGTKSMKKSIELAHYDKVSTKRREFTQDSSQAELTQCNSNVEELKSQIEEHKKKINVISQQPTCNPVFKRFLTRLLKDIQRAGLPSDSTEAFYDAKVKMSRQALTEIQTLLEGEENWRTGALDTAVSQILVDLKPHNYEAWKWRFEDTFGVELDTLLKMVVCVLLIMTIVCTQMWSSVSWFMQFRRMFAICFFVSIVWNWFYLYKIAFAEHQNNMVKMDSANAKCTGVKKIDWSDSLKEWFRSTWTLQDDPCKRYYEVLMVNPILLVPPTKAISVTITTFITEPLKHLGLGISEFLRALLKDLPVTLQIPVLLTIVLSIVVFMYGSVQAAFQHGITAPFRRRGDPPLPEPGQQQHQPQVQRIQGREHLALKNEQEQDIDGGNRVHQRNPRSKEKQLRAVKTVVAADPPNSEDDTDTEQGEQSEVLERNVQVQEEKSSEARAGSPAAPKNTKRPHTDSSSKSKPKPENSSDSSTADVALRPQQTERQSSRTDETESEKCGSSDSVSFSHPVQEVGSCQAD